MYRHHTNEFPTLTNGEIEQYLSSGLFRGIGKKTASKLVAHFGGATLVVLDTEPEQLYQVEGLRGNQIDDITTVWQKSKSNPARQAAALLLGRGNPLGLTLKICEYYANKAMDVLREDPYRLIDDIEGIGFKKGDQIALSLGIAPDSDRRYQKAIFQALKDGLSEGHCFLPEARLVADALNLLTLPNYIPNRPKLLKAIADAKENQTLIDGQLSNSIYLKAAYRAELNVALKVRSMLDEPTNAIEYLEFWLKRWDNAYYPEEKAPSPEQRQALLMAQRHPISILTGGPGRGKTYILKLLVEWLLSQGQKVALAAPTGKAANRMENACGGYEAFTIHRLLQWKGKERVFSYNEDHPLPIDWVIVDEFSMVDIFLFNSLLKALPPNTKVLLVGDADQLPSVGAGMVLKDLLNSELIPNIRLQTIFRQQHQSAIIHAADAINRGKMPNLYQLDRISDCMDRGDCAWLETTTPEETAAKIVELATAMKERQVNLHEELIVLSPQKKGVSGVHNLNKLLQPIFNPKQEDKAETVDGEVIFRIGDRVIQLVNRYDTEPAVMNGETGRIIGANQEKMMVTVDFDGRAIVDYYGIELVQIMHSYCITCHKSQGSEFKYVIMPMLMSHYRMLTRQLFYTTITRATDTFIAVGQTKALGIAVTTDRPARRYTQLVNQLVETIDNLWQRYQTVAPKGKSTNTTKATITIASRLQQRQLEATNGQMTQIGSLALNLYEDKYGHRPSKQIEPVGNKRFKTYHYPSEATELIDRAINLVLNK